MNTNIGKLMSLISSGNCKVIDAATCIEDKDKVFAIIRKTFKYPLAINFELLAENGFYPSHMHKYEGKDEIVIKKK